MCEIIPKQDISVIDICEMFKMALSGNVAAILKLIEECAKIGKSIPDYLFYRNLEAVLKRIDKNGTAKRKVGKKLADSAYGDNYGYTLLRYIHSYEHESKGVFMANLLDAVSKDFISSNDCFRYCKTINDISLISLFFLKENVLKKELFDLKTYDRNSLNELKRNDLMYDSDSGGIAFELDAFLLDKYGLSYQEEKYSYRDKYAGIPTLAEFPDRPELLRTSPGRSYGK